MRSYWLFACCRCSTRAEAEQATLTTELGPLAGTLDIPTEGRMRAMVLLIAGRHDPVVRCARRVTEGAGETMKSTISVELDGTTFTCDERAYTALRSYLDRASARLGSHPDRADVIAGLERSIAAKLRQRAATLARGTLEEAAMLAALKEVGRVDGPVLDDSARNAEGGYDEPRTRKLYRLREGSWFAGVCAGIAAYAGIDPVIVRLAFILATVFSGGIVILVYLVLMFVMPIARTDAEISDAHRGPPRA